MKKLLHTPHHHNDASRPTSAGSRGLNSASGMIRRIMLILVLVLLITSCATPTPAVSEAQAVAQATPQPPPSLHERGILTLLPTEVLATNENLTISADNQGKATDYFLLRFKIDSFPPKAHITRAYLSLVSLKPTKISQLISVNMFNYEAPLIQASLDEADPALAYGYHTFGELSLSKNEPPAGTRGNWEATAATLQFMNISRDVQLSARKELHLSFGLKTQTIGKGGDWYSDKSIDIGNRPRLIIEYIVEDQPAVTQSNGLPAVQSSQTFWTANEPNTYVPVKFNSAWSNAPAFYNNLVYLVVGDTNAQKELQILDSIGNPAFAPLPLGDDPGKYLLISSSGVLYIVGEGKIHIFNLDSHGKPIEYGEYGMLDLKPTIAPTFGPDGSLYFVNNQQVYALNPDRQTLWKVPLTDMKTSRITVGPSGQFVYLITKNEGLLTINAQTGQSFTNKLPNQDDLSDNPTLHAPVVIRYPDPSGNEDGAEFIYVAANSAVNGVLARYNNLKTVVGQEDSGAIDRVDSWEPLKGLWGQPILDQLTPDANQANPQKKIYAVSVVGETGTLNSVDWLTGIAAPMTPTLAVGANSYLLNGGNLAMDKDGNLFLWNGSGEIGLYVFDSSLSGRLLELEDNDIPPEAQLSFGSDGILYLNEIGSQPTLRAVVPQNRFATAPAGTTRTNPNDGLVYVWIPPGEFQMGCSLDDPECLFQEEPRHSVTISHGFWLGQTEVTVGAYKAYAEQAGIAMPLSPPFNNEWSKLTLPMANINWDEAKAYCELGAKGRLPTEAEWEYAVRAGSEQARYANLNAVAWYMENSNGAAHPVGTRLPNAWGVYDGIGNVSEWVADFYDDFYYAKSPSVDPTGFAGGSLRGDTRVTRGGAWEYNAFSNRVSIRTYDIPDKPYTPYFNTAGGNLGGRCVWDSPEPYILLDTTSVPPNSVPLTPGTVRTNPNDNQSYVWIPPGEFQMGCSQGYSDCSPQHSVKISRGFWLGQTEVTVGAYKVYAEKNGIAMPIAPTGGWNDPSMPIEGVTWNEAKAYCEIAANGRLPNEAEWEYAVRAGSSGDLYGDFETIAWSRYNSNLVAHPVGQKAPNAWGVYDGIGNVWEWVMDWYHETYYSRSPLVDPLGAPQGDKRVLRGGSYNDYDGISRAWFRLPLKPANTFVSGIRCAWDTQDP